MILRFLNEELKVHMVIKQKKITFKKIRSQRETSLINCVH